MSVIALTGNIPVWNYNLFIRIPILPYKMVELPLVTVAGIIISILTQKYADPSLLNFSL